MLNWLSDPVLFHLNYEVWKADHWKCTNLKILMKLYLQQKLDLFKYEQCAAGAGLNFLVIKTVQHSEKCLSKKFNSSEIIIVRKYHCQITHMGTAPVRWEIIEISALN